MDAAVTKQLKALALLVALVLVAGFIFGDVSVKLGAFLGQSPERNVATAGGTCPTFQGALSVDHAQCTPAGHPGMGGRDGQPCVVTVASVPGSAGTITGTCMQGCCTGIGLGAVGPGDAASSFFSDLGLGGIGEFVGELGKGVLFSSAMQLVGRAFQPGGGEGSGEFGQGTNFRGSSQFSSTDVDDSYLQYDSTSNTREDGGSIDLAFGSDNEEEQQSNGAQNGRIASAPEEKSIGDSITTAYEYVRNIASGGSRESGAAPLGDGSNFDEDYYGGSLGSDSRTDRLTQEELERTALAQRERAAQYDAGNEDTSGLTDYDSSAVARSNVRGNPLSTGDDENNEVQQNGGPGFFARIGNFFSRLFGF